ncbi:hypothetical protein CXQ82_03595 [Pseudomonas sp. S09G 359]|nr:hypothetical protein CXQ82_03595 [Pseudomonas sp. S09G 359]
MRSYPRQVNQRCGWAKSALAVVGSGKVPRVSSEKRRRYKCGSGLAREGGGSFSTCLADIPLSRASPLPH